MTDPRVAKTAELKAKIDALGQTFYAYHRTVQAADNLYWTLREREDACHWWEFGRRRHIRRERQAAWRTILLAQRDMEATRVEMDALIAEMYAL